MHTILLVEDEELLRSGIQEVLELQGFQVLVAGDGAEALDRMAGTRVDLVVTDLVMPNMDGVEFVRRVREDQPALPVIVVSGSSGSVATRLGIGSIDIPGATAAFPKPFSATDLVGRIRELLPA
ncbi:response regulator transcription factor [Ramlibacter sp. MAHUQ-53]|uniref:response regulator transcription factor n=1 Tax=unclassified Ramlibacter TaxID=2617605 RepID=UPI0036382B63